MGPKNNDKNMKKKKTKEEKEQERLLKEEQERLQAAIEQQRIEDEKEAKRLEDLRIFNEYVELRKNELDRLNIENEELQLKNKKKWIKFCDEEKSRKEIFEWKKFRNPTDEFDAMLDSDMNTFLSILEDEQPQPFPAVLESIKRIEKVSNAMEKVFCNTLALLQENDQILQQRSLNYLRRFIHIIFQKYNTATALYLKHMDSYLNEKSQELHLEVTALSTCLALWGSFSDSRLPRKSVVFDSLGIQLDIQKQLLQQEIRYIFRMMRIPIDIYTRPESQYHVVGDIISFDILQPPQRSVVMPGKNWTIRDDSTRSNNIKQIAYPSSVGCRCYIKVPFHVIMSEDIRIAVWNETFHDWREEGISDFQYIASANLVQFVINTVGILALVKKRNIDFPYKNWNLSPMIMKSRIDSPYEYVQSASRKVGGVFKLITLKFPITIHIVDDDCILVEPILENLKNLLNVPMSPGQLVYKLMLCGINILPRYDLDKTLTSSMQRESEMMNQVQNDLVLSEASSQSIMDSSTNQQNDSPETEELVSSVAEETNESKTISPVNQLYVNKKLPILEEDVLLAISKCASAIEFQCCNVWNNELKYYEIGLLARESNVYCGAHATVEFDCILAQMDKFSNSFIRAKQEDILTSSSSGVKYLLIMGNEYNSKKEFSLEPRPSEVTHVDLIKTLQRRITKDALINIEQCDERFHQAVNSLLRLIKPFSF